jgi:hypothetical protein
VSPDYLHPEFGWLCPSTSLRRKLRLALTSLALLAIVGTLALRAGRVPQIEGAPIPARGEEALPNAETAQLIIPTATTDQPRSPQVVRVLCDEDPWSYIDGTCKSVKPHRRQSTRAANNFASVSRLLLGRSTRPAIASSETHVGAGADPSAAAATLAMSVPTTPRAPAHPKVHKPSANRNGGRDSPGNSNWRADPWSAQANAFPGNRNAGNRDSWSWGWGWSSTPTNHPTRR